MISALAHDLNRSATVIKASRPPEAPTSSISFAEPMLLSDFRVDWTGADVFSANTAPGDYLVTWAGRCKHPDDLSWNHAGPGMPVAFRFDTPGRLVVGAGDPALPAIVWAMPGLIQGGGPDELVTGSAIVRSPGGQLWVANNGPVTGAGTVRIQGPITGFRLYPENGKPIDGPIQFTKPGWRRVLICDALDRQVGEITFYHGVYDSAGGLDSATGLPLEAPGVPLPIPKDLWGNVAYTVD
jgi:hypothetical protein